MRPFNQYYIIYIVSIAYRDNVTNRVILVMIVIIVFYGYYLYYYLYYLKTIANNSYKNINYIYIKRTCYIKTYNQSINQKLNINIFS